MNPEDYITQAKMVADKSPCNFQISCLLIDRKGKIVATGYNHHGNRRNMGQPTVHAEVNALNKVRKPSSNLVAFIYRKHGRIITPCPACHEILASYGIVDVWYTAGEDGNNIMIKKMRLV